MPSLAALMMDMDSLAPEFYTPVLYINETDIKETGKDLEAQNMKRVVETHQEARRKLDKKKKKRKKN